MTQDNWRPVDTTQIQMLYTAFTTDTIAPACLRAIESRMLSAGMLFTSTDYSKVASADFQTHINQYFTRFVRDALFQLLVCGFCFFTIETSYPRVIPIGLADIRWKVDQENYNIEMAVFKRGKQHPDNNVFSIIENTVDAYGNLTSNMSNYLRARSVQDAFMRFALTADGLNARPAIYVETLTDRLFDERDIAGIGEVNGLNATETQNDMHLRSRLAVGSLEYNEQLVRKLNAKSSSEKRAERVDSVTGLAHADADMRDALQAVVPLPADYKVANAPRATARADIVSICSHYESLACVAFGVNAESIGASVRGGGHVGAATLDKINGVTSETTARWARIFEPTLINVYNIIWGGKKKTSKQTDDMEEEESIESDDGSDILPNNDLCVVFPSTLPASLVERLFVSRVITLKTYQQYLSTVLQLPMSSFEDKDHRMDLVSDGPKGGDYKTQARGGLGVEN